jgi:ATP-dependent protease ClpP protease subunit
MTKQVRMQEEDEDGPMLRNPFGSEHLPYFESSKKSRLITAYLDETIRESKYYRPLLQAIETLQQGDILQLNVNSYGGMLDGAVSIINSMQETEADVFCFIDGVAASAASMIALASPNLSVGPYASMMIHSATFGSFGKQSDVISHASFMDKRVKVLMQDIYEGFLTPKELDDVFMGKEIWLNSDEIIERLELRAEYQSKQQEEAAKPKPKAKPRSKPKVKPEELSE